MQNPSWDLEELLHLHKQPLVTASAINQSMDQLSQPHLTI